MHDRPAHTYSYFVGHFINEFSKLEFFLRRLLNEVSGLSRHDFAILIGNPRTEEVVSKLRKLTPHRLPADGQDDVTAALKQLEQITRFRNWVVHYGGHDGLTDHPDKFLVRLPPTEVNEATGGAYLLLEREEAWAAASDILTISITVNGWLDPTHSSDVRPGRLPGGYPETPWRYKPPRLRQIQKQHPSASRTQPRPPQS